MRVRPIEKNISDGEPTGKLNLSIELGRPVIFCRYHHQKQKDNQDLLDFSVGFCT